MQEQWKILVVMTFLGMVGCGKGYPKLESPKKPIEVVINSQDDLAKGRLGIKKSQFNKDFLMIPTMRSVSAKPQWESFAPKVVQFQRAGKYVSLNERIIDRVYDEISTNDDALLLQSFEITSETDDVVYINWKFGFDWIPESNHDDEDLAGDSSTKQVALDVVESFTKKLEFQGDTFVSEQRIRIREPELIKGRDLVNNELVYDLNIKMRPYSVNEQFATRESRLMQGFGMFTIPRLRKNQNKSYDLITRWDITNKPIQIAMSSAIPSEYADAIQEGFEYWNRVLNRKVVEVQRGASPSSQLQEGQVIVHWVNWDDAGFAYADMQNDPITGQTLQGQIYLTSSWVKFAELDQEVHTRRVGISDHSAGHIRLGGFGRANSCSRPVPKEISRVVHARNLDERKNNISHVL
ncbi:MAG TPA: hypothetical protein PLU50_10730, partial [Pseudobdellovibrionaceae bacterium]|nr:hypothetical protein [Pseudobdellovibrionaceae bacterium]